MATTTNTIQIKRSGTSGAPSQLKLGELAYSYLTASGNPTTNGGDRLFIGANGVNGSTGYANDVIVIGGKYFTDLLSGTRGTLTASSAILTDSSSKIDRLLTTGLAFGGTSGAGLDYTISTTGNNNLVLTAGTGKISINGAYTLPNADGTSGYVLTTNGSGVVSWQAASSSLAIAADTGSASTVSLLTQTFTIAGGNGIVTSVNGQTITISSIGAGGYTSTATAAGTTTLSSSSTANQFFTGTTTQTVKLPSTSTLTLGQEFIITNNSTGIVTVQTSAAGAVGTIPGGSQATFTVASTSAQTWIYEYTGTSAQTGTGAMVLANSPSLTSPSFSTIVNTGTLTLPTSTDTLVGRATTDTLTNKTFDTAGTGNVFKVNGNSISAYTGTGSTVVLSAAPTITGHPTIEGVTSTGATGTGKFVFDTSPTLVTPTLGVATATTINKLTITTPATGSTLTIADGKTLTASNTLTFTGTDGSSVAFGTGGTVTYTSNNLSVFAATTSAQLAGVISDETGTGALVFANTPTLVTPVLGAATATSIVASAGFVSTGVFAGTFTDGVIVDYDSANSNARISAGGSDKITFYNSADTTRTALLTIGATGHITVEGVTSTGATGTGNFVFSSSPSISSPTVTGHPTVEGVTSTGATGTGKFVFDTSPTIATPSISSPTITGHATVEGVTATGATGTGKFVFDTSPTISGATLTNHVTVEGVTSTGATGTGNFVFSSSPTLVTPTLGVATATSINGLTISSTTGTLTIANGKTLTASNTLTFTGTDSSSVAFGTGGTVVYTSNNLSVFAATTSAQLAGVISDETGSGALVFANSPTLVTPTLGAATATSITGSSGSFTIAPASGNNSINLQPTGTGTVDVNNARITSVASPTQATDAANKAYVDNSAAGLNVKNPVQVATTAALTVTYNNGTSGVGATLTNAGTQAAITIDSYPLELGDRILVKDQADSKQNGIYTVTTVGTISANWVLTRATDADNNTNGGKLTPNTFVFVEEGTVNANNGYTLQIAADDQLTYTLGTDLLVWVQFSGAGEIIAGAGLTKSGNTLDVQVGSGVTIISDTVQLASTVAGAGLTFTSGVIDVVGTSNRITINADSIDIASTYVGQTSITTLGTIGTGTWQGDVVTYAYGGTGQASYAKGDILYASASNTLSKLSAGSDGQVLQLQNGVPVWSVLDGGSY